MAQEGESLLPGKAERVLYRVGSELVGVQYSPSLNCTPSDIKG